MSEGRQPEVDFLQASLPVDVHRSFKLWPSFTPVSKNALGSTSVNLLVFLYEFEFYETFNKSTTIFHGQHSYRP